MTWLVALAGVRSWRWKVLLIFFSFFSCYCLMKGNWIGNRSTARHRGAFLLVGAQSENTSSPTDALGAQQLPDENISHPASALHLPAARRPYWSATLGRTIAFVPRSRTASWNFGDDSSVSTVLDNNGFHYFFFRFTIRLRLCVPNFDAHWKMFFLSCFLRLRRSIDSRVLEEKKKKVWWNAMPPPPLRHSLLVVVVLLCGHLGMTK